MFVRTDVQIYDQVWIRTGVQTLIHMYVLTYLLVYIALYVIARWNSNVPSSVRIEPMAHIQIMAVVSTRCQNEGRKAFGGSLMGSAELIKNRDSLNKEI